MFRNLLVDVTGNTHRAEICIDKLYSPEGPTGRLGLVEFRAFEMPPRCRMSLAQQLAAAGARRPVLARALARRLWCAGARRCMTVSCCRISSGRISSASSAISGARAIAFDRAWFGAQWEFRFPFFGAVEHGGVKLELRQALEPWHVMGEEGAAGGTVRYVDSSVERLQIKASGLMQAATPSPATAAACR